MDYRIGTCSQCGAEYKVPTSFAHDAARCKECDGGVVRFAPLKSAGGDTQTQPIPARKVVRKPEIEEVSVADADKKKKERGTLARLRAERAAAAQGGAAPAAASKPAPAAPAAAARPAAKPSVKPAGAKAGASKPSASRSGAGRSGAGGSKRASGGAARRGGGKRGAKSDDKKKSPAPLIGVVALLVILGGGAFYLFGGSGDAATDGVSAAESDATPTDGTAETTEDAGADTAAEAPADEPAEDTAADAAAAEAAAAEAAPEPEKKKEADPSSVDLAAIEDFGPARGTTDEEWTQMNEWVDTFLDLDAGAAGNRAGGKLEAMGRKAVPILINKMKTLDYGTDQGYRDGDICQKKLQAIFNGANFDWRYSTSNEDHYFNKRVVESWAKTWRQVVVDIEAFIKAAKLETKDPDEAKRLRELYGEGDASGGDDPVSDDDLDVD